MKKRENMTELKVNMNYKTGRKVENNCRIASAGSELDKMYQQCYDDYMKVQEWNEKKRPSQIYTKSISINKIDAKAIEQEREWSIFYK